MNITSKLHQSARSVTVNKERANKEKEVRKAETSIKNVISNNTRKLAYKNIIDTIRSTSGGISLGVQKTKQKRTSSWLTSILVVNWLIYQISDGWRSIQPWSKNLIRQYRPMQPRLPPLHIYWCPAVRHIRSEPTKLNRLGTLDPPHQ